MKATSRTKPSPWCWESTWRGRREVLGLWVAQSEGAKFWLQVLTELQNRGVKDILISREFQYV